MFKHPLSFLVLFLALLLTAGVSADNTRISIIELHNRTASEMMPLVEPMVVPEGTVTGTGFKLILRTTPANSEEIMALVSRLDTAPQRLLITVHIGELSGSDRLNAGTHVNQTRGDVQIRSGSPPGSNRGARIINETRHGVIGGIVYSTRNRNEAENRFSLQTLEGQAAYIETGTAFPVITYTGGYSRHGHRDTATSIDYQQASSGFYALAHVHGNQVTLDINPQKEALDHTLPGAIQSTSAVTRVSGKLGQWIEIGRVGSSGHDRDSMPVNTRQTRDRSAQALWLKVDSLD